MRDKPLIGMIHLPDLTRFSQYSLSYCKDYALQEAKKLEELDFSGIMVENFNDSPFVKSRVDDHVFMKIGLIMDHLKENISIPLGINILRNASLQALQIASILDLDFIRCNIYEGAYITDQGIIEGEAFRLQQLKKELHSKVEIFADVHVKHAYPMGQFSVLEAAENAVLRGKADRVIVSGISTGRQPDMEKIQTLSESGFKPLIGSGLNLANIKQYESMISGAIVGTAIKYDNNVLKEIDSKKAKELIKLWNEFH